MNIKCNKRITWNNIEQLSKKTLKLDVEKKQKAINTITDAIKARRARNELQTLAIEQANKTAGKWTEIGKTAKELVNSCKRKSHKKSKGKNPNKLFLYMDMNISRLAPK